MEEPPRKDKTQSARKEEQSPSTHLGKDGGKAQKIRKIGEVRIRRMRETPTMRVRIFQKMREIIREISPQNHIRKTNRILGMNPDQNIA